MTTTRPDAKALPPLARKILRAGGWLMGSRVHTPNPEADVDIMIPYGDWAVVALLIPRVARPTNLGGWRFLDGDVQVDVWPGSLEEVVTTPLFRAAYHPNTGTLLERAL